MAIRNGARRLEAVRHGTRLLGRYTRCEFKPACGPSDNTRMTCRVSTTMRTRILSVCSLVLALAAVPSHAYRIVEAKYRVELAPGVFQDQLVVRCDDGRQLTLAWETQLRAACRESPLVGPDAAPTPDAHRSPGIAAHSHPAPVTDFGSSIEVKKRMHLTRLRILFGEVPEQLIAFEQGPDGVTLRYAPALAAVLQRFEACRAAHGSDCVAVRNASYARLRGHAFPLPAATAFLSAAGNGTRSIAGTAPAADPVRRARRSFEPRIVQSAGAPSARAADVARAGARAIEEQYRRCMRAEPKAACEQARAHALVAGDKTYGKGQKPAGRPARNAPVPPT